MLSSFQTLLFATCAANAAFATAVPKTDKVFDVTSIFDGDLLVYLTDGTHTIMNHSTWEERLTYDGILLSPPEVNRTHLDWKPSVSIDLNGDGKSDLKIFVRNVVRGLITLIPDAVHKKLPRSIQDELKKRSNVDEGDITSFITKKTEHFVDWDIQMSNVICATSSLMSIWVTQGWSVANKLEVSAGIDTGALIKTLSANFGFSAARTWTTEASTQNKGDINVGTCGVMITKPLTTRRYGNAYKGSPGYRYQTGTFMADDHGNGEYNHIKWIAGAVSMCAKKGKNPPLSRCQGQGYFI